MEKNYRNISFKGKLLLFSAVIIILFLSLIVWTNVWVVQTANSKLYDKLENVPHNDVALLLGTSKFNKTGNANLFFKYRIEAVTELYHSGKVKHIILSGDNK